METRIINPSAMSIVLILMASASLFTMLSLSQINYIINGDLYNYGLQFSYRWAMPYWIFSGIIFGLSWGNIFLSIIVTLYIIKKTRKHASKIPREKVEIVQLPQEERGQKHLNEFFQPQAEETTQTTEPIEAYAETPIEPSVKEDSSTPEETAETVEVVKTEEQPQEAQSEPEPQPQPELQPETPPEQQQIEQESEPVQQAEETHIPPEEAEQSPSIL